MAHYEALPPRGADQHHHSLRDTGYHYGSPRNAHYDANRSNRYSTHLSTGSEPHLRQSRSSYSLRPAQLSEPLYRTPARRMGPPHPYVEDEWTALAKEHNPQYTVDSDIASRGTIDQEPLLIELINSERRFVLVSDAVPTTKLKHQKASRKAELQGRKKDTAPRVVEPPKLNVETDHLLERRVPTPYSFTKPDTGKATSGEYLLSPESTLPKQSSSVPRSMPLFPETSRKLEKTRSDPSEGSSVDQKETARRRAAYRGGSARSSTTDPVGLPSRNARPDDKASTHTPLLRKEASRMSMAGSLPQGSPLDERSDTPRASILNPPATTKGRRDTRSDSYYDSHPRSDLPRHTSTSGAEPLTPKLPQYFHLDSPRGKSSARTDSRPTTPSSPYEPFPFESPLDMYERQTSAPYSSHKQNQPSKFSPPVNQQSRANESISSRNNNSVDANLPYPGESQKRKGTSLPYPDADSFVAMPSEHTFLRSDSFGPPRAAPLERSTSTASNSSTASSAKRHATTAESRTSRTSSLRTTYEPVSDSTHRSIPRPPPLPTCPRQDYSTLYDDWWTLDAYPDFDVCPTCLEGIIRPSPYRRLFVPAKLRSSHVSIRCDFGNPWTRLAWLLTIQQQREDLSLITALARRWELEQPCSGSEESYGPWWGLVDSDLYFVQNFYICSRDKMNIELLFPSLTGAFTRIPSTASSSPHHCSMRLGTRRYPKYIDLISTINDKAVKRFVHEAATSPSWDLRPRKLAGSADARPIIEFAKTLAPIPECPRDQIDNNVAWHYVPDFPDITVCQECFDAVIRPDLLRAPVLASLFTRTPQPLGFPASIPESPAARLANTSGLTCQMYSPRMKDVWDRAVEDDDVEYLVRKMRERREKEVQLRRQKAELVRMLNRGSMDMYAGGGVNRELLKRNLSRVAREWEEYE